MVAAPLTSLLQGGKQRLNWTQASKQSFRQLKERFTSAPILHHPSPDLEFTVEVIEVMLLTQVSGQFFPSDRAVHSNSSHAPSTLANSIQQREIMMWGTGNC